MQNKDSERFSRLVGESVHNTGIEAPDAEVYVLFVNLGDVCNGGTPTLEIDKSDSDEIRMHNHITSGRCKH